MGKIIRMKKGPLLPETEGLFPYRYEDENYTRLLEEVTPPRAGRHSSGVPRTQ